ncbi:hypothetical protein HDU98_001728 [Podochytrium sp. JEL0797]|nr:hypothetical protein HDU98_001728 [Podochytrium sp. JEL0797]
MFRTPSLRRPMFRAIRSFVSTSQPPHITSGPIVTSHRSRFQAHLARIHHPSQLPLILAEIKLQKRMKSATHQIVAYRFATGECGKDDDGEGGAGERMLMVLERRGVVDVVVVVTRWYGGVKLGGDRFRIIAGCVKDLLDETKM